MSVVVDPLARSAVAYAETVGQVGMWLALPAHTPEKIVTTYADAFSATLDDPQYRSEFAKIDPDSPVMSKTELEQLVRELATVSAATLDFIQAELKRQGFGTN